MIISGSCQKVGKKSFPELGFFGKKNTCPTDKWDENKRGNNVADHGHREGFPCGETISRHGNRDRPSKLDDRKHGYNEHVNYLKQGRVIISAELVMLKCHYAQDSTQGRAAGFPKERVNHGNRGFDFSLRHILPPKL